MIPEVQPALFQTQAYSSEVPLSSTKLKGAQGFSAAHLRKAAKVFSTCLLGLKLLKT